MSFVAPQATAANVQNFEYLHNKLTQRGFELVGEEHKVYVIAETNVDYCISFKDDLFRINEVAVFSIKKIEKYYSFTGKIEYFTKDLFFGKIDHFTHPDFMTDLCSSLNLIGNNYYFTKKREEGLLKLLQNIELSLKLGDTDHALRLIASELALPF